MQIEGLQQPSGSGPPSKKVVYGNRKKKGPNANGASGASPTPSRPRTPEPKVVKAVETQPTSTNGSADGSAKDDWDASSDEETQPVPDVKDSWDALSDEEEETKPTPALVKSSKPSERMSFPLLSL